MIRSEYKKCLVLVTDQNVQKLHTASYIRLIFLVLSLLKIMTSIWYIRKTHGGLNINYISIPATSYDNAEQPS